MIMKKSRLVLSVLLAIVLITFISCNKNVKETATTPQASAAVAGMSKEEQKNLEASMQADAVELAKATCNARKAKMQAERRPESEFYVKKAKNLMAAKNKLAAEIKAKYEKDPATKEMFSAALQEAWQGLEECKQFTFKKNQ
jgi:hypothetical protein